MQIVRSWFASANRWRVYKFTALAVLYGLFLAACIEALPFRTGAQLLLCTNPLFAFFAIYGMSFRRPI